MSTSEGGIEVIQSNAVKPREVSPLPVGPGGNNSTKQQLNQMNTKMAMMLAQANADKKFDPDTPQTVTPQIIVKDTFVGSMDSSDSLSATLGILGILVFVYGLVAK